jgi:exodeoxyribonuclease VII small subunit
MTKEEIGQLKYDEALRLLKEISERLENKEVSMDDLTAEVQKANLLAEHCKTKLKSTETEIKRILDTDA